MWPNPQLPADLVTFTEEILNFLWSAITQYSETEHYMALFISYNFLCSVLWKSKKLMELLEKDSERRQS